MNYYQNELSKLSSEHLVIKLYSQGGETKNLNVNKDSIPILLKYLEHLNNGTLNEFKQQKVNLDSDDYHKFGYYLSELQNLSDKHIVVKLYSKNAETKSLNLNTESIPYFSTFLKDIASELSLKNYMKGASSYLQEFVNLHTEKLNDILKKVENERPSFDSIFKTVTMLESMRTDKSVLFILNENNHIKDSLYADNNVVFADYLSGAKEAHKFYYYDNELKTSYIYKDDVLSVNTSPILTEAIMQYKYQQNVLNMENLETSDDIKMYIAYLFSMRSEVDTTKIGATFYNNKDELIGDGYNALSSSFDKKFRYLINISSLIPLVDDFIANNHPSLNKGDFIKEIYAFRESAITTHAEANALENIKEYQKNLIGGHAIVPFYPCENCAAKICNSISSQKADMSKKSNFFIVIDPNFKGNSPSEQANWLESIKKANQTFDSNNIQLVNYVPNGNIVKFVQLAHSMEEKIPQQSKNLTINT